MLSGTILWCNTCGSYSELRGAGIAKRFPWPLDAALFGGRAQQLRALRAAKHPKAGRPIPHGVSEIRWGTAEGFQPSGRVGATGPLTQRIGQRGFCTRDLKPASQLRCTVATGVCAASSSVVARDSRSKVARLIAAATGVGDTGDAPAGSLPVPAPPVGFVAGLERQLPAAPLLRAPLYGHLPSAVFRAANPSCSGAVHVYEAPKASTAIVCRVRTTVLRR